MTGPDEADVLAAMMDAILDQVPPQPGEQHAIDALLRGDASQGGLYRLTDAEVAAWEATGRLPVNPDPDVIVTRPARLGPYLVSRWYRLPPLRLP